MDITNGLYIIMGDVNCDGKIDMDDFIAVEKHILGIETLTGDSFIAADVNGDGSITGEDLSAIKSHIDGRIPISSTILKGVINNADN